ncbi:glucose-1-phosphate adenylyltransferase subunit GlgD [Carnobacterium inhibens]|uniref:Glucose-1-phosphate adenylyltransferase subunit GlgD n=1 Tax=Carnobacterium inhibens TaxID=147709 RepID=A0ABR7TAJ1_9LACT|nr:glucose-1-phosphate adenylyltransferase subunit GlgD [Carnobacterium inhibens]MBC9824271.1 glucose-1-phosphate adenylyltransferase subunit GlgD [Carnobacterium inhibens]
MKTNQQLCAVLNLDESEPQLMPLTKRRAVAALPFGSRYRLIDFPLSSLYSAEVNSVAMFVRGSARALMDHVRSGYPWGMESTVGGGLFIHSGAEIKEALERLEPGQISSYYQDQIDFVKHSQKGYVVVMGSKMLCNVDIKGVLRSHIESQADITVVYKNVSRGFCLPDSIDNCLSFEVEGDSKITDLLPANELPKEETKMAIGMGIAIMSSETFIELTTEAANNRIKGDINVLIRYNLKKYTVHGYEYTGYLKNIETVSSYYDANMDLLDEDNYNALFYRSQPVITKVKNGAPTYYSKEANISNSQFASDCVINGTVEDSVVFRKVVIEKNAVIKRSLIMQGSKVAAGAELDYVILDKGVKIGPGVKLSGTKDEPLVIEKGREITVEKES